MVNRIPEGVERGLDSFHLAEGKAFTLLVPHGVISLRPVRRGGKLDLDVLSANGATVIFGESAELKQLTATDSVP